MDFSFASSGALAGVSEFLGGLQGSLSLENILKIGLFYLFFTWASLIIWVARDITNRSSSILFQAFCILLIIILSPLGIFIYLLIRPQQTSFEKYYEGEVSHEHDLGETCPECAMNTRPDWKFCPNCKTRLQKDCPGCSALIENAWEYCPFCGVDTTKAPEKSFQKELLTKKTSDTPKPEEDTKKSSE